MTDADIGSESGREVGSTGAAERRNERSTIQFPYLDLDAGVEVAVALYQRAGLGSCELDELAAEMGQTVSGAFRAKTAAARMYGLIEKDGRSGVVLTSLGREMVHSETEASARARSFLEIPLYSAIYDKYRGHLLPPPKALEREMVGLGVAPKQADKARQVFERSAKQAGFFEHGDDRLVQPRTERGPSTIAVESDVSSGDRSRSGDAVSNEGGAGPRVPAGPVEKPLRYQLIDLLDPDEMNDAEQQAVFTLINYLARKKGKETSGTEQGETDKTTAAKDDESSAAEMFR